MEFPARRLRRLRRTPVIRDLVAETSLDVNDLVAPLFVAEGIDAPRPIAALPGHGQHTLDSLRLEVRRLVALGVRSVLLFGLPEAKDAEGSSAWDPDGIVQIALRDLRDEHGDGLCVMADLCLDEYTEHGHCGILLDDGTVDNDATLERYARIAVVQADAGADVVAPSGMMDGQVAAIRAALEDNGHHDTIVLAYAAKYATALYGPFREAVNVSIAHGDRRAYQQDLRNRTEAVTEVLADIAEGADIVMVKPALSCLDVIADVAAVADVPVAAYHVSGEYAMVKAAAERGWLDGTAVGLEHLTAIRRAGADFVVTYFAAEAAEALGG
jgi:porphobilinogen synthase